MLRFQGAFRVPPAKPGDLGIMLDDLHSRGKPQCGKYGRDLCRMCELRQAFPF